MNAIRTFIDTNILIYAFSADEPVKRETAIKKINGCSAVISTQIIKEFSNVLFKKTKLGINAIHETITEIYSAMEVVNEDINSIFDSFGLIKKYGYSFYDSLVIATALRSKCRVLLSEDFYNGQLIENKLKIVNPFVEVN